MRQPPNRTGLPDRLKAGVEALSGLSMDDVRVHRNSSEPARLGALAFARGGDIHLGPGQERHLPHEAWHIVQQKQGRVVATASEGGAPINEDSGLEREAHAMGRRAEHGPSAPPERLADVPALRTAAQCAGHIRFANLSGNAIYVAKGESIRQALLATPAIQAFLQDKDALITLESVPELASVTVVGDQVQISLSPWFFEQESRGRILGMIAHEFGVHPLPNQVPGLRGQEGQALNAPHPTGLANETVTAAAAGQRDHIFAAVAVQAPFVAGRTRFDVYRDTVFQIATSLLATAAGPNPGGVNRAHVTDLIMTYLADIAMILATNDDRPRVASNLRRTGQIFNLERARWIGWLNAKVAANNAAAQAAAPQAQAQAQAQAAPGNPPNAVLNALLALTPAPEDALGVLGEGASLKGRQGLAFMRFWQRPTSDINMRHQPQGQGAAPTNRNQANVMADHGLQLVPAQGNATGLIDALSLAGLQNWRNAAFLQLFGLAQPDADAIRMTQILGGNQVIRRELTGGELARLAWAVQRRIRVLQPTGKMLQEGDAQHALVTLVWVREPAPHYRAAQPIVQPAPAAALPAPIAAQAAPVAAPVGAAPAAPIAQPTQNAVPANRARAATI
jgi:hypothetical protein